MNEDERLDKEYEKFKNSPEAKSFWPHILLIIAALGAFNIWSLYYVPNLQGLS